MCGRPVLIRILNFYPKYFWRDQNGKKVLRQAYNKTVNQHQQNMVNHRFSVVSILAIVLAISFQECKFKLHNDGVKLKCNKNNGIEV